MTTVVTMPGSVAYAIYLNGNKVVECLNPETTFNELVKALGLDTNVQVVEGNSFPKTLDTQALLGKGNTMEIGETNLDDIINNVNAGMVAGKLGAYRKSGFVSDTDTPDSNAVYRLDSVTESNVNAPVGSVAKPELGDLVYVDGMNGVLRTVLGGIGTVSLVFTKNDDQNMYAADQVFQDDEDESDDESDLFIELEEAPGAYFSWKELRDRQDALQEKYGHRPAQVIR